MLVDVELDCKCPKCGVNSQFKTTVKLDAVNSNISVSGIIKSMIDTLECVTCGYENLRGRKIEIYGKVNERETSKMVRLHTSSSEKTSDTIGDGPINDEE